MGHHHLGTLSRSRVWQEVVRLIGGGADVNDVAAATSVAAELQMMDASTDPAVKRSLFLLAQIPSAARQSDFVGALRGLDLVVGDRPALVEITAALSDAIDRYVDRNGARTDLGEMAQLAATESLSAVAGRQLVDLFEVTPDAVRRALASLATVVRFADLAREFFSRLARRQLSYFLSRELSNHVGVNQRFRTIREHRDFEEALDLHCREASRIVGNYSGEWFSKHTYEGGIDEVKAGRFGAVAFDKIRKELRLRRGANA